MRTKKFFKKSDLKLLLNCFMIALIFSGGFYANFAKGDAITLSATITSSLTFVATTGTDDQFGDVAAGGAYDFATTTLSVTTNSSTGYRVELYGVNQGSNAASTTMYLSPTSYSTSLADQTEWTPGYVGASVSTTTAGTAVIRSGLDSANVLAVRVMSASSTNGVSFLATTWWGETDVDGTAKWAGISSSTASFLTGRVIGQPGAGSYSASAHLNTVNYYLKVDASQTTGAYTAPLVFTATAI
ncbi:MAG: hypothetical protein V1692_03050 [bacterium]